MVSVYVPTGHTTSLNFICLSRLEKIEDQGKAGIYYNRRVVYSHITRAHVYKKSKAIYITRVPSEAKIYNYHNLIKSTLALTKLPVKRLAWAELRL